MSWWLLADIVGIIAVPTLHFSIRRLEKALGSIASSIERIKLDLNETVPALDGLPALEETQMLIGAGQFGIIRYADALEKAL